ncbi:MAG TPA: adenosylmethionine decarboxylase [Candidatus Cloacimonadota bacterium]|jgi:S-adenosylmethionine decarboxylase proenzyme|nr:adenosylmethionine decarboxylase [Candidatus Cloacimonadota bacterium]
MQALGRQILVEFYQCNEDILKNCGLIEEYMVEACKIAQATVVTNTFHEFSPFGVSGVVVIAESHVAIHTWPEYNYAAVDIFTCGETIDPWKVFKHLEEKFESAQSSMMEMKRGLFDFNDKKLKHKPEGV